MISHLGLRWNPSCFRWFLRIIPTLLTGVCIPVSQSLDGVLQFLDTVLGKPMSRCSGRCCDANLERHISSIQ
ncbi:hypothetical protein F4823DRAFT_610109 [Ustulina deusta]|nr:hypothetical protein F4823DRAFT_610109 [Ustulina deusta]